MYSKWPKYSILFLIFWALTPESKAQVKDSLLYDNELAIFGNIQQDLSEQLLPLDSIVKIALKNSPTLKVNDAVIGKAEQQINVDRLTWMNGMIPFVNVTGGNQDLILQTNSGLGQAQSSTLSNGVAFGLNLRLPLYEIFGRQARVNASKMELKASKYKKEEAELALRRQIILEYNDVLAFHRLMRLHNDATQASKINLILAEKSFRDGVLDLASYTQIMQIVTTNENNLEMAKRSFTIAFNQLETTVGVSISKLRK